MKFVKVMKNFKLYGVFFQDIDLKEKFLRNVCWYCSENIYKFMETFIFRVCLLPHSVITSFVENSIKI